MKNKSFKCLNKSCGISYSDKHLGACPVCGSDNVKLETKKWPIILVVLFLLVGLLFIFLPSKDVIDIPKPPIEGEVPGNPIVFKCDTSKLDLFDLECNSGKQTVSIKITGYEEDSCGKLHYSVNGSEVKDATVIQVPNIKSDSLFNIIIYDENKSEIKSFIWPNNCFVPKTDCNAKQDLILDFQKSFKSFLNDPSNIGSVSNLKSLAKKIGFKNKNIATTFDNKLTNMKLINLMNKVSGSRQFANTKTKIIGDFEIELTNSNSCPVGGVKVELKSF